MTNIWKVGSTLHANIALSSVTNPSNGKVLGSVPDMDRSDAQAAIETAYRTFQAWKSTLPKVTLHNWKWMYFPSINYRHHSAK